MAVATLLASCSRSRPIRVGSKNFTEQVILGEIAAQHLERRLGVSVDRRFNLGGTLLAHQALAGGQIDVLPEYTGTALTAVLKMKPLPDAGEVFRVVQREYRSRWRLEWLDPLGFNNTFCMVIRGAEAREAGIRTLSDAALARAGWRLGAGYEFEQRPDGLAGLLRTYGLFLSEPPRSMDLGLLYAALKQRQVDMIAANSTDGLLSVLDVQVLEDDKRYFPPYEAALVVGSGLPASADVKKALGELSGKFTGETMRRLNHQVDGEHRRPREVAAAFLQSAGLGARPRH